MAAAVPMNAPASPPGGPERLQKVLSAAGVASRRAAERLIADGRVTVNGQTVREPGTRADPACDEVRVDGRRIAREVRRRYLLLHKPRGYVTTRSDPHRRRTVLDLIPGVRDYVYPVGRLDYDSEGLLLLTNDGALAHRMMHPSTGLDREYAARVDGRLEEPELQALTTGVMVDDERHRFSDVKYYNGSGRNHWYHVVLMEGRNREVRKLFEGVGVQVNRLKRVRYGPVVLPSRLKRGAFAELGKADLTDLYRLLKLPFTPPRGRTKRKPGETFLLPYPSLKHLQAPEPT